MIVTLACASALKVTLEYAKLTLAAPAQKTQLSSSSSTIMFLIFVWQRNSANHQLGEKELIPTSCPCAIAFSC